MSGASIRRNSKSRNDCCLQAAPPLHPVGRAFPYSSMLRACLRGEAAARVCQTGLPWPSPRSPNVVAIYPSYKTGGDATSPPETPSSSRLLTATAIRRIRVRRQQARVELCRCRRRTSMVAVCSTDATGFPRSGPPLTANGPCRIHGIVLDPLCGNVNLCCCPMRDRSFAHVHHDTGGQASRQNDP
jgi:hypothetical protein